MEVLYVAVALVGSFTVASVVYRLLSYPKAQNYKGKHVVIVGGSEGICKEVANDFAKKGAKVTIMARTLTKLEKAKAEIIKDIGLTEDSRVINFAQVDVTKYDTVLSGFAEVCSKFGDIDVLVLGAGKSCPGYILDQEMEIFEKSMDLNYLGSVRCAKVVIPHMLESIKKQSREDRKKFSKQICFIGSTCSILTFLGYGSYSPSKFAIKGFADTLRNELQGTGISVSFACPPDTDTPGYEEEMKTKPKENVEMFPPEVFSAQSVSAYIIDGMERKEYMLLNPDFGQNLVIGSTSGLISRNRWLVFFVGIAPITHLVLLFLRSNADKVATKYGKSLIQKVPAKKIESGVKEVVDKLHKN